MGGENFRTCPGRPWGPLSLLYNAYRVFPGGKERPERDADPLFPSSAVVKKRWSYASTPPMDREACTESEGLYKGGIHLTSDETLSGCTTNIVSLKSVSSQRLGHFSVSRGREVIHKL
jgi:hypothetical protein